MGAFIPNTIDQRKKMLGEIGLNNMNDLFNDLPKECVYKDELGIPNGLSEIEVTDSITKMAKKNKVFDKIFRGAGSYNHYIPSTVSSISLKEEFLTAYTPYQGEISQGILQSIFEYQTMICEITGMQYSNASVYDGATAAAEAVSMCADKKHEVVLIAETVDKRIIDTVYTYNLGKNLEIKIVPMKNGEVDKDILEEMLNERSACVLMQQPNFYGVLEDVDLIEKLVHNFKAKLIMSCYPTSLGLLKTPGEYGADIAVGDGQPLGLNLAYGGPYLGYMATTKNMFRKLPGRIVGETMDKGEKKGYVLTLQAREQHIRREKASSNICSNQAHCALKTAIYLSTLGKEGFKEVAVQCASKAKYLQSELSKVGLDLLYKKPYFNEFVTKGEYSNEILKKLEDNNILGGLPLGDDKILWCVTELISKEDMDNLVMFIKGVNDEFNI